MPRVSLKPTGQSFEVSSNSILYHALNDQGFDLPHGCLAGSCGACCIFVYEGKENLSPVSAVENDTLMSLQHQHPKNEITLRLSCRAKILKDDVTIGPLS